VSNSTKFIRSLLKVNRTPRNKGMELTIKIGVYDNGMVTVNGSPMSSGNERATWLAANRVASQMIEIFSQEPRS